MDMQYVVSRHRVVNYVAKYTTKSEYRFLIKTLKSVYGTIMKTMQDDAAPIKMVQKLMVSSVGERDFSAQETCRLLLQLPLYRASRDFVVLSLDGSRQVNDNLKESTVVTMDSQLDQYCARPATPHFENLTLLQFLKKYRMARRVGDNLFRRKREVVVIVCPYCSPDLNGPQYEKYCKQKLMINHACNGAVVSFLVQIG